MKTATKGTKTNLNKNSPEGNKNEAKHGKRKVPIKDFTGKSTKDINELHELRQKLKTVEQERDSLRTVIEMLKADNDQRSDHEWQVIEAKTNKTAPTKGKNFDTTTVQGEPVQNEPLQVSNQYAVLDSNDVSCKTLSEAETGQNEEKSTVKALKHGTVVIGDSMLKGFIRQHSISRATRSNVQIKCFPGARL